MASFSSMKADLLKFSTILFTCCQKSFLSSIHDSSALKCCVIKKPPPKNVVNVIGNGKGLNSFPSFRVNVTENSPGFPFIVTKASPFIV